MEYLPEPTLLEAVRIYKKENKGKDPAAEYEKVKEIYEKKLEDVKKKNQVRQRAEEVGIPLGKENRKEMTVKEARKAYKHIYTETERPKSLKKFLKELKAMDSDSKATMYVNPDTNQVTIRLRKTDEEKNKLRVNLLTSAGKEAHPNVLYKAAAAAGLTVKEYMAKKKKEKEAEAE